MSAKYPRIGSKNRVTRGRCIVCKYAPRDPQYAKIPGRPMFRVDIQHTYMRGDDSVFNVCQCCYTPSAGELLEKIAAATEKPAIPAICSEVEEVGVLKERLRVVKGIRQRLDDPNIHPAQKSSLQELAAWVRGGGA